MFNKRLLTLVEDSKKYIALNVFFQWLALLCNVYIIFALGTILEHTLLRSISKTILLHHGLGVLIAITLRFGLFVASSKMSYLSSKDVKVILREKIYQKILQLGNKYQETINTSEVIQVAVEGVDQLEIYFGRYLPQFFYSLLAPFTLFVILSFNDFTSAFILFLCVPLIPISIIVIQKIAKKLLQKYWGSYTALGDSFLENLQGLTTLKIYKADKMKQEEMNVQAENFRKITMKVLIMQLNSITIMDIVAYGGAALGIIMAITQYQNGNTNFLACFMLILLSAEYFIPLRLLGSYFHIAMNGMAASNRIFALLDLETKEKGTIEIDTSNIDIQIENLSFGYDDDKTILHNISMSTRNTNCIAIAGESGCGKSTIASLLMGRYQQYTGTIEIDDINMQDILEESHMKTITLVNHNSQLFKGSVKDNLLMANRNASDSELWKVLEMVGLSSFIKEANGLDTLLNESGSNLSGGQKQRLGLARAILHDSNIYIFDEATSNIDVESENKIMEVISQLSKTKKVIIISHRLANIINSDLIYVMDRGVIVEQGTHQKLLENNGTYANMYLTQQSLESIHERSQKHA